MLTDAASEMYGMKSRRLSSILSRGIALPAWSLLIVWAALVAALWWGQERLRFEPKPLAANLRIEVPNVTEDWVDVPGVKLHAIHFHQRTVDGVRHTKGLIVYLHGNVSYVGTWFVNPGFWRESGYDLWMMDYRGFGKSTGRIDSEAQLHSDVRAASIAGYRRRAKLLVGKTGRLAKRFKSSETWSLPQARPSHRPGVPSFVRGARVTMEFRAEWA
jgi:hypothetical protein